MWAFFLSFSVCVWLNSGHQRLQNSAARLVLPDRCWRHCNSCPFRCVLSTNCVWSVTSLFLPYFSLLNFWYFDSIFTSMHSVLTTSLHLSIPTCTLSFGKQTFSCVGMKLWNYLLHNLHPIDCTKYFKLWRCTFSRKIVTISLPQLSFLCAVLELFW